MSSQSKYVVPVLAALCGLDADRCPQSVLFAGAFRKTHDVLLIASKSKEPDQSSEVYRDILKPLGMGIEETVKVRDTNRGSPQSNQLNMLAEGAGVLAWVQIKPRPDEYVGELLGGAQMYGNRILKEFKESDPIQVDWVRAFVKCCGALKAYIKDNHPRGLVWNNNGVAADVALRQVQSSGASAAPAAPAPPAPAAGGPPPPPPPMPAAFQLQNPQAAPAGGDMGAVFADLNRGESVTAGLKKVDKSEMTHKNPALRAQGGDAPVARGKSPAPARKPETLRTKKPSRKEFEANKWLIENFDQADMPAGTPIEINAEKQHSVLISRCKNVTIRVNGKANAISLDNCSRVDLLVDSLVSALDVINTSNFRAQVLGTLPSVQLDKVDSGIIFLSKDSLDCQVFTSKCSSINITLPPASEADDSVECPIPEQMVSYIKDGQMVSEIVKQEG